MKYSNYHRARKYARKSWLAARRGDLFAEFRYDALFKRYSDRDFTGKLY